MGKTKDVKDAIRGKRGRGWQCCAIFTVAMVILILLSALGYMLP